jgi:hypothetical protein
VISASVILATPKSSIFRTPASVMRMFSGLMRFALIKWHGDKKPSVPGLADLEDRADVRVIERGGGLRLAPESLFHRRVVVIAARQKFERDLAFEREVHRPENLAHAAAAEPAENFVMRNELIFENLVFRTAFGGCFRDRTGGFGLRPPLGVFDQGFDLAAQIEGFGIETA